MLAIVYTNSIHCGFSCIVYPATIYVCIGLFVLRLGFYHFSSPSDCEHVRWHIANTYIYGFGYIYSYLCIDFIQYMLFILYIHIHISYVLYHSFRVLCFSLQLKSFCFFFVLHILGCVLFSFFSRTSDSLFS